MSHSRTRIFHNWDTQTHSLKAHIARVGKERHRQLKSRKTGQPSPRKPEPSLGQGNTATGCCSIHSDIPDSYHHDQLSGSKQVTYLLAAHRP